MNASQNPELYYLVNPIYSKKLHNKTEQKPIIRNIPKKKDKMFYKKRIQQMTKDCMQNNPGNTAIEDAFNEYLFTCIQYFKEEDTREVIQEEYNDLILSDTPVGNDIDVNDLNEDLYLKKEDPKIEDYLSITKSLINAKEKVEYPKQKTLDIKTSKFKLKGVKKKEKK